MQSAVTVHVSRLVTLSATMGTYVLHVRLMTAGWHTYRSYSHAKGEQALGLCVLTPPKVVRLCSAEACL